MTASEMTEQDRFSRQRDLVPMDRLSCITSTVIGAGAIGRQIALQLAAIGAAEVRLARLEPLVNELLGSVRLRRWSRHRRLREIKSLLQ